MKATKFSAFYAGNSPLLRKPTQKLLLRKRRNACTAHRRQQGFTWPRPTKAASTDLLPNSPPQMWQVIVLGFGAERGDDPISDPHTSRCSCRFSGGTKRPQLWHLAQEGPERLKSCPSKPIWLCDANSNQTLCSKGHTEGRSRGSRLGPDCTNRALTALEPEIHSSVQWRQLWGMTKKQHIYIYIHISYLYTVIYL